MKRPLSLLSFLALSILLPARVHGQGATLVQNRCVNSACHGGSITFTPVSSTAPTGWPAVVSRMNGYLPIMGEPVLTGSEVSQIGAYLEATYPTLTITGPASLPAGTRGNPYGPVQFTRSGVAASASWVASGLPAGMSISSGGSLSGTPSAAGSFFPQFTVTDSNGTVKSVSLSLTINAPPPSITGPTSLSGATVGIAYGPVTFTATGGTGSYTWSATGLPSGLVLSSGGVLSGTPGAGTAGDYNLQVTVKDSSNATASVNLSLTVNAAATPLSIATSSLAPGAVGTAYGPVQLTANGGTGGYSWSATGLPNGLALSSSGVLSGTPANGSQGSYSPRFTVQDLSNATASATLALTISAAGSGLTITAPASLSLGTVGTGYGPVQFTASGGAGGYTWTATGLPNGLTINLNTGALGGTPASGSQGSYNPSFTVTDSNHATASVTLALTINAAASSAAPWISAIPNPVAAMNGNQTVTINGIGFQSGSGLKVRVATSGFTQDLSGGQVSFLSAAQLTIQLNVGSNAANWTAQVINPDGQSSNLFSFSVTTQAVNVTVAMPQLVFGGGWYTALYFSNSTGSAVNVPVNFIGDGGAPLSVPLSGIGPATSRIVSLNAGSSAILEAPNTGSLVQGWAEVSLPPGVTGYAVFRQSVAGRADQEAVVPLVSESSQAADVVYDDVNFTTSVAVLNPSNQQVVVTILLYASNGSQIGSGQLVLAARSKQAAALRNLPGMAAAAGKRGWATFSVTQGAVAVVGLRFGGEAFTSIPDSHRSGAGSTLFAAPHLVFGGGWYTALYFSNTTTAALSVAVNFIGDTGAPLSVPLTGIGSVSSQTVSLNPGSTVFLEAPNEGALSQGWAEINLPPGVVGYAVFRQSVTGRADQEAVVQLTSESNQTADLVFDDVNFTTSVAILNPSNQQVTVAAVLYGNDGSLIGSGQITLAARSKQAAALRDLPGLSTAAGKRGHVIFAVPAGSVAVLGFRFGGQAFTSIPDTHR